MPSDFDENGESLWGTCWGENVCDDDKRPVPPICSLCGSRINGKGWMNFHTFERRCNFCFNVPENAEHIEQHFENARLLRGYVTGHYSDPRPEGWFKAGIHKRGN